jgi:hypothetical protein
MLEHRSSGLVLILAGPSLIELTNLAEWDLFPRQAARQLRQTVEIPGQDSTIRGPKIVLFSHVRNLLQQAVYAVDEPPDSQLGYQATA